MYLDTPLRGLQALMKHFGLGYDLLNMDDATAARMSGDLTTLLQDKPALEWERLGQEEFGTSIGLVQSNREWLRDRHALESATVVEVEDPILGPMSQPGYPVALSVSSPRVRHGRRMVDVAGRPGLDWLHAAWRQPSVEPEIVQLPLAGTRVLDCSSLLAGPTATRVLAQYGAEVIKLDRAGIANEPVNLLTDDLSAFIGHRTVNAGKRMVFLDLSGPAGRNVLWALVGSADILHHNFTPTAARKLGLAGDDARAVNPDIVYSTMSMHSHGGFRAGYRGHDMVAQVTTGMGWKPGTTQAETQAIYINDQAGGHLSAFGMMLALLHRSRTGQTQDVNASLSRTATMHQFPFLLDYAGKEWATPDGDSTRWDAVNRLYRAKDGGFFLAHGPQGGSAEALAAVPFLAGASVVPERDFATWLESRLAEQSVAASVDALVAAGLGAHRHVPLDDLLHDAGEGPMRISVLHHPGIGAALGINLPQYRTDGTSDREHGALSARRPGLDTIAVLAEAALADKVTQLLQAGSIAVGENGVVNDTRQPATGRARGRRAWR